MRTVFADSNYWIGLLNPKDNQHAVTLTDRTITDPNTDVVPLSGMLFRDALVEYRRHLDKQ